MTTKSTNKNFIKLAKILLEGISNKDEILQKLNIKAPTFYKYLNIMKKAGLKIIKNKGCYQLKAYKNLIKIMPFEKSILAYLNFLSFYLLPDKKTKKFKSTLDNMLYFCEEKDKNEVFEKFESYKIASAQNDFKEKINLIQKHIEEKRNAILTLASGKTKDAVLVDFEYKKEKIYILYKDNEKNKKFSIPIEKIVKITSQKEKTLNIDHETIFELYGKLAKSYLLKEKERIVDSFKERIVIANGSSDKETLFKRLLRYDVLCKVLFPKNDVDEFQKLIKNSLDNINKIQDNVVIEI